MRRVLAAIVIAPLMGCAAVLGLRDIEPADGTPTSPAPEASVADVSSARDAGDAASIAPITCFDASLPAFYCDGFEGPKVDEQSWTLTLQPPEPATEVTTVAKTPLDGAQVLSVFVESGSGEETAKARWQRPDGAGPLAFQLNVRIPKDAWANDDKVTLATMSTSDDHQVGLLFTANGTGSNGALSLTVDGASVDLDALPEDTWTCIEIFADGENVKATRNGQPRESLPFPHAVTGVDLGVATTLLGKQYLYDDVVFAPKPIGCLH